MYVCKHLRPVSFEVHFITKQNVALLCYLQMEYVHNDNVGKLTTILVYNICNSDSCIKIILHPSSPSCQSKLYNSIHSG